jgi:hypothetical protein
LEGKEDAMNLRERICVVGILAVAGLASGASGEYRPGFVWQRSADWTPGTVEGCAYARGNPDDDAKGYPVWSAEWVGGGGPLGSGDVWYKHDPKLMVWQNMPWGESEPRWLCGMDHGPQVKPNRLDHDLDGPPFDLFDGAPLVRWTNPTQRVADFEIGGPITIIWSGVFDVAFPTVVDVVIAHVSGETGAIQPLMTISAAKPNNDTVSEATSFSVPNIAVAVGPHDQIIWSIRGRTASPTGAWVVLVDHDLKITLKGYNECEADFNHDGQVDFFDYLDYVVAFNGCGS